MTATTTTCSLPALSKWDRNRTGYSLVRPGAGHLVLVHVDGAKWRVELYPIKPNHHEAGNSLGRMQCLGTCQTVAQAFVAANEHYALSAFRTNSKVGSLPLHGDA